MESSVVTSRDAFPSGMAPGRSIAAGGAATDISTELDRRVAPRPRTTIWPTSSTVPAALRMAG
eukprot:3474371-Prymnesium_polylepis.1